MREKNSQSSDKDEEEKEDKISKLSDKLIHHILYFCYSMRFAVKTSILSKRWRYIWTSLPTLSFTSSEYDGRPFCPWGSRKWIQPTFFENFVDNALILRNQKSDINKFGLSWYLDRHIETDTIRNHLNTWINAALNRDVAILSVDIGGLLGSDTSELIDSKSEIFRHQFTSKLFNCATLTKLKLKVDIQIYDAEIGDYCKDYLSKINFPKPVHLPCLSVLKLDSIVIDNANSLFLGTPVLEYLSIKGCKISIDNCSDMDWFGILSLTLKYFELKNCIMPKKIKLNVPNLQTLVCEDYTWHEYSMENISSLVCARIEMLDFSSQGDGDHYLKLPEHEKKLCATRAMDFLKALDTVNELQLSPGILEIVSGIPNLLDGRPAYQFGSVRCLKLVTCHVRTCLQAISYSMKIIPSIESLRVEILNRHTTPDYWRWYHDPTEDWEVTFLSPCMLSQLKSVKIIGLRGSDSEFNLVEFLLSNASNLKEVVLYKSYDNNCE